MKTETVHITLYDSLRARDLAARLVDQSNWFEVTPLADDEWEFSVKTCDSSALRHAISLLADE